MDRVQRPERTRDSTVRRREKAAGEIIDAAERTISREGLAALRARDLADEAGCSLGFIYKLFGSLDDVVLAVNLRTLALLDSQFLKVVADTKAEGLETAVDRLVALAVAYFEFASAYSPRWRALFEHRLPQGTSVPEEYAAETGRLFTYIEEPLRVIRPGLGQSEMSLLARSLFSATHGMVMLGLEEKLSPINMSDLRSQLSIIVRAVALGLQTTSGTVS